MGTEVTNPNVPELDKGGMNIISTDHHRNGISGCPFTIHLIQEGDDTKVVIMFNGHPDCVAVLSVDQLAKGDIFFGSNSWRGDVYAHKISKLVGA